MWKLRQNWVFLMKLKDHYRQGYQTLYVTKGLKGG